MCIILRKRKEHKRHTKIMYLAEFVAAADKSEGDNRSSSSVGIIDGFFMHDLAKKSQAVSSFHYLFHFVFVSFRLTSCFLPFHR